MNYGATVYGGYSRIGEAEDEGAARSRHFQATAGRVVIIIILLLLLLVGIWAGIASTIAADESKHCHCNRVRMKWDLAEDDECDDMNPCTIDFIDHADDDSRAVCTNHPRPNGFACESPCFFPEEEGTHRCKNLGKGCAECRGTRCKGECRRDRDCPRGGGRGPLLPVPQRAGCMDGICVWEFFEEFRVVNFPCDVEVLRRRCMRFVKPEFRDCIIAEPSCGLQFPRGKKDDLPLLPKDDAADSTSSAGGVDADKHLERTDHGADVGPVLTRCAFSFKCARPKEPLILRDHASSSSDSNETPFTPTTTTTKEEEGDSSLSAVDSFLEKNTRVDDLTVEDFKKLTKKSSKSHGRTSSDSRRSHHSIEGTAAKRS